MNLGAILAAAKAAKAKEGSKCDHLCLHNSFNLKFNLIETEEADKAGGKVRKSSLNSFGALG